MRSVLLGAVAAVGAVMTIGAAPVFAAGSYSDQVAGVEMLPAGNTSSFVGFASGSLPGTWEVSVTHGPLPAAQGGTGAIISGTFALQTHIGFRPVTVSGRFMPSPNAITLVAESSNGSVCTQVYTVTDALALGSPVAGSGHFAATLTHYGFGSAASCVVVFASVHGSVTLTF